MWPMCCMPSGRCRVRQVCAVKGVHNHNVMCGYFQHTSNHCADTFNNDSMTACYKETQQLGMHRQSEPRAGNHQRHTRTRNVSLPTQANHTVRGARKQPPNWGATHAASEDTTHTSNHTACHQGRKRRPAWHPPRAQQAPSQHTDN